MSANDERFLFRSVLVLYAVEALLTGLLVARLPDIKSAAGLSNAAFGTVLLGMPAGTVLGFTIAAGTVARVGLTRTSWLSVLALSIVSIGPAIAGSAPTLFLAFVLVGCGLSHTEVIQNSMAGHLERVGGRRVMSRCHGGWSLGSIAGLLIGGASSQGMVPLPVQGGLAAACGVAAAWMLSRALPRVPPRIVAKRSGRVALRDRVPPLALLSLCLLPLGTLALEGIVRDWGAIFLRDDLGAAPFASTLLFVVVSTSMAAVRLCGDALLDRLGERAVVGGSILCAGAGVLLVSAAPSLGTALLGAAITGVGVAVVYPVALSIAARRSEVPERDVALMSFVCFVTLMASPAAVGSLSDAVGLRATFGAFAALSLLALTLLPTVDGRSRGRERSGRPGR